MTAFNSHAAIGFLETLGMGPAVKGADSMLKTADVELLAYENVGSTLVTVMVRGDLSAVEASVAAGVAAASAVGKVTARNVIPRPTRMVAAIAREYAVENLPHEPPRALALVETFGLVALMEAADAMEKAADIDVVGFENVASGYISVLAYGDVSACEAATAAGVKTVKAMGAEVHSAFVIPTPHPELVKITKRYALRT